jgi:hypothetical protein
VPATSRWHNPDLIVTLTFNEDDPLDYWGIAADGPLEQIQQVAPIIALSGVRAADAITARHAELAAALGVNLEAPEVVVAHDELTAAEAALTDAQGAYVGEGTRLRLDSPASSDVGTW